MAGEYTEKLPRIPQGTLRVRKNEWDIQFYFKGPDFRYNGTFFVIRSYEIDKYIQAYKDNWEEYIALKNKIPVNGSYETQGKQKMTIRIGGFVEGVCLTSYHLPINNEANLKQIIRALRWAKNRANSVMENNPENINENTNATVHIKSSALNNDANSEIEKTIKGLKLNVSLIMKQQEKDKNTIESLSIRVEKQNNTISQLRSEIQEHQNQINALRALNEEIEKQRNRGILRFFSSKE